MEYLKILPEELAKQTFKVQDTDRYKLLEAISDLSTQLAAQQVYNETNKQPQIDSNMINKAIKEALTFKVRTAMGTSDIGLDKLMSMLYKVIGENQDSIKVRPDETAVFKVKSNAATGSNYVRF